MRDGLLRIKDSHEKDAKVIEYVPESNQLDSQGGQADSGGACVPIQDSQNIVEDGKYESLYHNYREFFKLRGAYKSYLRAVRIKTRRGW